MLQSSFETTALVNSTWAKMSQLFILDKLDKKYKIWWKHSRSASTKAPTNNPSNNIFESSPFSGFDAHGPFRWNSESKNNKPGPAQVGAISKAQK